MLKPGLLPVQAVDLALKSRTLLCVPIPMKVVGDSDLIPVTHSDTKPVRVGAKRRWRSYRARSDRDRSTGI